MDAGANVRVGTEADRGEIWELFRTGFGVDPHHRDDWLSALDTRRAMVVDGTHGELAGVVHIRPFDQWFGARPVPMAGYSPVVVAPQHRNRGLARRLVAAPLADLRARGEVIASLFPASLALYRSVGFECAGSYVHRRFPVTDLASIGPARRRLVRRGTVDDVTAIHRCHADALPGRDGAVTRTADWWARSLPTTLDGVEVYVVDDPDREGEVAGYAIYRHRKARPPYDFAVSVFEVLAEDPDVLRSLWQVVGSSGTQAPEVDVIGPAEDDLFLLAANATADVVRSEIRWMLRVVDLPAAVAARGWPAGASGTVDLEVLDEQAPWNAGRWRLEVEGGDARATPGGTGTVALTIGALSSWWAGYATPARLARTGSLRCVDPRALRTMAGLVPACPPVLVDFF